MDLTCSRAVASKPFQVSPPEKQPAETRGTRARREVKCIAVREVFGVGVVCLVAEGYGSVRSVLIILNEEVECADGEGRVCVEGTYIDCCP